MAGAPNEPEARVDTRFGWWPSPWSAAAVAAGKVSRGTLGTDGAAVLWTESRPADGGRTAVVRSVPGLPPADVSPPGVSVRTRVHEYGGGATTADDGVLYYVDQDDQGWHRWSMGGGDAGPVALTDPPGSEPEGPEVVSVRFADGRCLPGGDWLISVEERVSPGGTGHRLVALSTHPGTPPTGPATGRSPLVLLDRGDFVAAPRPSPDGEWLAWVTWDHPSMPWDSSELWVARIVRGPGTVTLEGSHRLAGGEGVSVGQPRWCRDGSLVFVDDRLGWWLPYRLPPEDLGRAGSEAPEPLVDRAGEFHSPDWVLGQATMAELPDGSLVARLHRQGRDQLVRLRPPDTSRHPPWSMEVIDQPCVAIAGVVVTDPAPATEARLCVLGSTPTEAQAVFEVAWADAGPHSDAGPPARRLSAGPEAAVDPTFVSAASPFTAVGPAGPVPGLFYAPTNPQVAGSTSGGSPSDGPAPVPPPLVVFCHGGPTAAVDGGFDPLIQFFTSRGLAVAAVNYRGSSGFGRTYRRQLDGLWGEADIDDCVAYAVALADAGLVDGGRMVIRGTSAGGLTALGALIRSRSFVGAASWYGVTDLAALATDTHDFESRYLDSLVGPWPEAADLYRARSPLYHPDQVAGSVLLLQGADDPVVPADQSERFAAQLTEHGVSCRLVVFPGESHGFRRADTIEASVEAELGFYRSLFDRPVPSGSPVDRV